MCQEYCKFHDHNSIKEKRSYTSYLEPTPIINSISDVSTIFRKRVRCTPSPETNPDGVGISIRTLTTQSQWKGLESLLNKDNSATRPLCVVECVTDKTTGLSIDGKCDHDTPPVRRTSRWKGPSGPSFESTLNRGSVRTSTVRSQKGRVETLVRCEVSRFSGICP